MRFSSLLYLLIIIMTSNGQCPSSVLLSMDLVLEYALWRGWHQAVIYTPKLEQACQPSLIKLVKCLSVNGIASSQSSGVKHRMLSSLGLVVMAPTLKENTTEHFATLLKKLSEAEMNTAAYDWLVTARSERDFKQMNTILNETSIRFDQNIVVSYAAYSRIKQLSVCQNNFVYRSNRRRERRRNTRDCAYRNEPTCTKIEQEINYFKSSERFRNLSRYATYRSSGKTVPLQRSGITNFNYSKPFQMTNITEFTLKSKYSSLWNYVWSKKDRLNNSKNAIHLIQYFKVRINYTLYGNYLGTWSHGYSMSNIETPYPVEARNFLGEELVVGRCNATDDGSTKIDDDGPSSPDLLDDILHFLAVRLNVSTSIRFFPKLGFRSYEGAWTGLLGALVDGSVDLALEPVTAHAPRHTDMDFVFPIAETMCNIYIRHQETSTVRDIFFAPFSPRLIICVVAIALAAALSVVLVSRLAPATQDQRPIEYAEALIWSAGILCQQGGSWTPASPAASTLLIVCLLFAVVTYNSYAAFITSVLSVRVASVDTPAAVLYSTNFKIGYIRNGADQMYLMSTKDSVLNAIYIRGYSDAENLVTNAGEGLARAAVHDYAFFAGQRAARLTLRSLSQARGRCALRELPVPSTRAQLAFPMPKGSPYARPTLVSLLQLRNGGALARLGAALVPPMPQCDPPAGFASARATDVRSALILLSIGLITALGLGIGEYCWKNRKQLLKSSFKVYRRLVALVHVT